MRKTATLYDPYLDTLGGGERYILSILKVLNDQGYKTSIFWDKDLTFEINNRLSLQYNIKLEFLPNIFRKSAPLGFINKLIALKKFDYFLYVTDGSYFVSSAKKNFTYIMVPKKEIVNMNIINRLKTINHTFITHSQFTKNWLEKNGINSLLLYPYIEIPDDKSFNKEKIIVSVGRFFKHLHSKRQDLAIKFFRELKQNNSLFKDFKLVLAGGLNNEDKTYFDEIRKIAGNDSSIILKPNISRQELDLLYKQAMFYWHFSGYGVDEEKNPHLVEHMGITPLEAAAAGTIPFCYEAGGPKEIITDGINGFLFKNEDELIKKMSKIITDEDLQNKIRAAGVQFVKDNFSYDIFKKNVFKILNIKNQT